MDATATLGGQATDADECRRLAELLNLDAVGIVRIEGGRRRVSWWAAPETDVVPLERVLEGSAAGWVAFPSGDDVVFAHLSEGSPVRSVTTLSAMLATLSGARPAEGVVDLDGVASGDPIERDRTQLAYAIHDGLTQVVTALVLELEWQARRVEETPGDAVTALTESAVELRRALEEIRGVLASLSRSSDPSVKPIEDLVQDVIERWQLPAEWSVEGDVNAVPRELLQVVTSVIREGVANAAKHAASDDVAVRVHASSDGVEVRIEDRGRGFRTAGIGVHAGHLGLEMMRRRVADVGGTLDIESTPGSGTRVVARLPVPGTHPHSIREQGVKP